MYYWHLALYHFLCSLTTIPAHCCVCPTLKTQGHGWFKGIVQISKVQVKYDITRVIKDVRLAFIIFGTPRS